MQASHCCFGFTRWSVRWTWMTPSWSCQSKCFKPWYNSNGWVIQNVSLSTGYSRNHSFTHSKNTHYICLCFLWRSHTSCYFYCPSQTYLKSESSIVKLHYNVSFHHITMTLLLHKDCLCAVVLKYNKRVWLKDSSLRHPEGRASRLWKLSTEHLQLETYPSSDYCAWKLKKSLSWLDDSLHCYSYITVHSSWRQALRLKCVNLMALISSKCTEQAVLPVSITGDGQVQLP